VSDSANHCQKSGGGGPFERDPRHEIRYRYHAGEPGMNARWRKSSHSGHAGENCVEITLSIARNAKTDKTISPLRYGRTAETRPGFVYSPSRG
jgi:hypothetical protein